MHSRGNLLKYYQSLAQIKPDKVATLLYNLAANKYVICNKKVKSSFLARLLIKRVQCFFIKVITN